MGKRGRDGAAKRERGRLGSPVPLDGLPALPTTHGTAPPLIVGPAALPTSEKFVLGESVTHRCVELIADAVASAVWGEWRGDEPIDPPSRLVRRPWGDYDGGPTRRDWAWKVAATMALYSWCPLLRVGAPDSEGVVGSLVPVLPGDVGRLPGSRDWTYRGENVGPRGIRVILRTVWPSIDSEVASVLTLARDVFSAAMAAVSAEAAFWEAGGAPHTVLTYEGKLPQQTLDELRQKYVQQRIDNPGQPAVLAGGLKLESFGSDLGTSGAGEAASRVGAAVARYFGVPPHYVNVPNYASSLTYQNTETAGIDFVRYTLGAYAAAIGDAMGEELPGDGIGAGRTVRLDLRHLTRAEQELRARSWQMALGKWMTREEVRMAEGLPAAPLAGSFDEAEPPEPAEAPASPASGVSVSPLQLVEGAA